MGVNYYNILKVSKDATEEDLKKSYKKMAMKWHPDKNAVNAEEAEAKFKQISEAYDVLTDPNKRKIYDLFGEDALKSGLYPPPNCRGGGCDGKVKKVAPPLEYKISCSFEELYMGSKRKMKISRTVIDHSGKARTIEEILAITIKPGWKNGTKITFPEKGNHEPNASPGNLIFVVDEKPHPIFKRTGNDLIVHRKISLLDALVGTTLDLRTLDGRELSIRVAEIVKPGHEMVIVNEGMPIAKEPGKNGNLKIKFDVKFPSRLSVEQKSDLRRVLAPNTD